MEQPKLLVDDIMSFVSRVVQLDDMKLGNLWTTSEKHTAESLILDAPNPKT